MAKQHIVRVGPVHAGIIGPGVFKFTCSGERVDNLEIELGFQHRGIEALIVKAQDSPLRMMTLAEQIAGDSTVAHAMAMAQILDNGVKEFKVYREGDKSNRDEELSIMVEMIYKERDIALEMERMAVNIGDAGAMMGDIAHQLGLVSCEALRTMVINTTQRLCGNRFGRTLIRPGGSHYRVDLDRTKDIVETLGQVVKRVMSVKRAMLSSPSVLARLEEVCVMPEAVERYNGDLKSRFLVRFDEVEASYNMIKQLCKELDRIWTSNHLKPNYLISLEPDSEYLSKVKGWRGEVRHYCRTDSNGEIVEYRVEDPSDKLWASISDSMKGVDISDFPVNNKSFNLSYSGTDK